jgi:hypothetical protein
MKFSAFLIIRNFRKLKKAVVGLIESFFREVKEDPAMLLYASWGWGMWVFIFAVAFEAEPPIWTAAFLAPYVLTAIWFFIRCLSNWFKAEWKIFKETS